MFISWALVDVISAVTVTFSLPPSSVNISGDALNVSSWSLSRNWIFAVAETSSSPIVASPVSVISRCASKIPSAVGAIVILPVLSADVPLAEMVIVNSAPSAPAATLSTDMS